MKELGSKLSPWTAEKLLWLPPLLALGGFGFSLISSKEKPCRFFTSVCGCFSTVGQELIIVFESVIGFFTPCITVNSQFMLL